MPGDDVVRELFAHNGWANRRLLAFCAGLTPKELKTTDAAIYGDIVPTMQHVVSGGEAVYWSMFTGSLPPWARADDNPATLEEVTAWAGDMASRWQELLSKPYPAVVHRKRSNGELVEMSAALVLTQTIHHGNVHREQVSHVLTSLGLEPPDISAWRYGRDAGTLVSRGAS